MVPKESQMSQEAHKKAAEGGFSFTHEKKVVDAGPVQISHQQTKTVPISPILSLVALVGGIGLVGLGLRGK
jgi:hypothetical protein